MIRLKGILVRSLFWTILICLSFTSASFAAGHGDEDPFPLACTDFTGQWKSDSGERYNIHQRNCGWLKIEMMSGDDSNTLTIVPDNRLHATPGYGSIRHRWNSPRNANVLEQHRVRIVDGLKITEITMFERASPGLLLQTTYRTIECMDESGKVRHEYEQVVFRRISGEQDEVLLPKRHKH